MELKIYYCEKCDNIKFPNGVQALQICRCCHKESLKVAEIEAEEVKT